MVTPPLVSCKQRWVCMFKRFDCCLRKPRWRALNTEHTAQAVCLWRCSSILFERRRLSACSSPPHNTADMCTAKWSAKYPMIPLNCKLEGSRGLWAIVYLGKQYSKRRAKGKRIALTQLYQNRPPKHHIGWYGKILDMVYLVQVHTLNVLIYDRKFWKNNKCSFTKSTILYVDLRNLQPTGICLNVEKSHLAAITH